MSESSRRQACIRALTRVVDDVPRAVAEAINGTEKVDRVSVELLSLAPETALGPPRQRPDGRSIAVALRVRVTPKSPEFWAIVGVTLCSLTAAELGPLLRQQKVIKPKPYKEVKVEVVDANLGERPSLHLPDKGVALRSVECEADPGSRAWVLTLRLLAHEESGVANPRLSEAQVKVYDGVM